MAHLTPADWDLYKAIIDEFHEDVNQEQIIWRRYVNTIDRYGEDKDPKNFQDINLLGLVQYNYFRNWPINKSMVAGKVDKESVMVYFNTQYLIDSNHTNVNNLLSFDPGKDFFIIRGLLYKCFGESQVAQANNKTLLQFIILKREEIQTGVTKY